MSESIFTRVNGEMLYSFRGQNVCMMGKLNKLAPDQMSFEITAPDNKNVLVKLRTPTREMLSDFIEVYGSVDEQGNIVCMNYTTFEPSVYENFDMDLYNETIQMIHQLPKHYIQAV
ncbi:replication A 14 kDa subunit [Brachionus plicatilis]|uniref:Replication A 14 kDa subunit n=1 Tax=Brachionus plicatilis TaxID=10195 RepID=A0A3M7SG86_BRAPC|nr:replication A 14 kDa subunit [Brachionus plicatilis]